VDHAHVLLRRAQVAGILEGDPRVPGLEQHGEHATPEIHRPDGLADAQPTLFGLAFVVVYREVFETILFYAALWTQGNGGALLAGAGVAVAVLGVIAWAMLRYSRQLPIAKFFAYSSWLMAGLTVVLAGKGVAALQEAGIIDIAPIADAPRLSMLGVFPTWQSIVAQLLMAIAIVVGFTFNKRSRVQASTLSAAE
jgi:high-affinity iron transporter